MIAGVYLSAQNLNKGYHVILSDGLGVHEGND